MAEAYCVKDKMKVEVVEPAADHHEERQAGAPGHLPEVRRQGLQDRRLTLTSSVTSPRRSTTLAGRPAGVVACRARGARASHPARDLREGRPSGSERALC